MAESKFSLDIIRAYNAEDYDQLEQIVQSKKQTERQACLDCMLKWSCTEKKPKLVKWLLNHGANPDKKTDTGETCLRMAVIDNEKYPCDSQTKIEIVQTLVDAGAEVDEQNSNGETVAHAVVQCCVSECYTLLHLLLETEIDLFIQNHEHITSIDYLLEKQDDIEYLPVFELLFEDIRQWYPEYVSQFITICEQLRYKKQIEVLKRYPKTVELLIHLCFIVSV